MSIIHRLLLVLTLFCVTPISTGAQELQKPEEIVGRWAVSTLREGTQPEQGRLFDFSPCGNGWCGVEVDAAGKCGRVAFRINWKGYDYEGRFVAAEGSKPYTVSARLSRNTDNNILSMEVTGYTGWSIFQDPSARSFPLEFYMSRQGDAVCKADAKTS